jgi:putative serine protease PepD
MEKKEQSSDMTDDPRYHRRRSPAPGGISRRPRATRNPVQAGYQQRTTGGSPPAQQYRDPYDPYRAGPPTHSGAVPTMVAPAAAAFARRRADRGALAIAVVSRGVGGTVVLLGGPDASRSRGAGGPAASGNVPAANLPIGRRAGRRQGGAQRGEAGDRDGQANEEGSGIILSADGLILTNNHVIAAANGGAQARAGCTASPGGPADRPAGTTTVTFADGRPRRSPWSAPTGQRHRGGQAQNVSGLTPITLGSSASLRVGQDVVAVGSRWASRAPSPRASSAPESSGLHRR